MLPFTSLNAVTSVGNGVVKDLEAVYSHHTMFVFPTGTPDTAHVNLQLSHDGTNWITVGPTIDGGSVRVEFEARYVRARLALLSGGSSPTITATIASK